MKRRRRRKVIINIASWAGVASEINPVLPLRVEVRYTAHFSGVTTPWPAYLCINN